MNRWKSVFFSNFNKDKYFSQINSKIITLLIVNYGELFRMNILIKFI